MKRIRFCLREYIWKVRQILACQSNRRAEAFRSIAGLWAGRSDLPETEAYIRELRKDDRLTRLSY